LKTTIEFIDLAMEKDLLSELWHQCVTELAKF